MDFRVRIAAMVIGSVLVGACDYVRHRSDDANIQAISSIRVGVLPDQDRSALEQRHSPLIQYLENATGLNLDLIIHDSYDVFSNAFDEQSIDLAWFGAVTFIRAEHTSHAEPLVMRDIDNRFVSHFIVRSEAFGDSIHDFKGTRLAFGSKLSTSGHVMPRHFLMERGIDPEEFFASVRNTSGHHNTARLVRDGEVDVGVVNSVILQSMIDDGRLDSNDVRVLEITPTYANYVWGVQRNLHKDIKLRLRNAFLALDPVDPDHAAILRLQHAAGFMPAMKIDFQAPRAAAREAGLLGALR